VRIVTKRTFAPQGSRIRSTLFSANVAAQRHRRNLGRSSTKGGAITGLCAETSGILESPVAELPVIPDVPCFWALDRNHQFQWLAGDPRAFFGRWPDQLLGRKVPEILPEEAAAVWRRRTDRVFAGETIFVQEPAWLPDGPRPDAAMFDISCLPVRSATGEIGFAGGMAQPSLAALAPLRNAALKLTHAEDARRRRILRFLHDDVGQSLSSAGLHLDLMRMEMEDSGPAWAAHTVEIQADLDRVIQRVRELSCELDPLMLERTSLSAALDHLAGFYRKNFPGTLRLRVDAGVSFPPESARAAARIAKEALDNAVMHSGCSEIEVMANDAHGPALEVRDNGRGFVVAQARSQCPGLGLVVMEDFAAKAGLILSIDAAPGRGTLVRVTPAPTHAETGAICPIAFSW
jgi:signal transduction histidine kinase